MKEVLRKKDIDKLSDKQQIEFYKRQFEYHHCESGYCKHEVGQTWVLYDEELFCESCFDYYVKEERNEAESEIKRLEKELNKAKERLSNFL